MDRRAIKGKTYAKLVQICTFPTPPETGTTAQLLILLNLSHYDDDYSVFGPIIAGNPESGNSIREIG
jgi:hypothetical protein